METDKICDIIDIINHTLNEQLYPDSLVRPGDVKMAKKTKFTLIILKPSSIFTF